jgi:hypothetical protein
MKNMFEALNEFLKLSGIKDMPLYSGNKVPPLEVQVKYLETLRETDDQYFRENRI